jgi:hypothetical protein
MLLYKRRLFFFIQKILSFFIYSVEFVDIFFYSDSRFNSHSDFHFDFHCDFHFDFQFNLHSDLHSDFIEFFLRCLS